MEQKSEKYVIKNDVVSIKDKQFEVTVDSLDEADGDKPVVVIVPDYSKTVRDYFVLSAYLSKNNFLAIRYEAAKAEKEELASSARAKEQVLELYQAVLKKVKEWYPNRKIYLVADGIGGMDVIQNEKEYQCLTIIAKEDIAFYKSYANPGKVEQSLGMVVYGDVEDENTDVLVNDIVSDDVAVTILHNCLCPVNRSMRGSKLLCKEVVESFVEQVTGKKENYIASSYADIECVSKLYRSME